MRFDVAVHNVVLMQKLGRLENLQHDLPNEFRLRQQTVRPQQTGDVVDRAVYL